MILKGRKERKEKVEREVREKKIRRSGVWGKRESERRES